MTSFAIDDDLIRRLAALLNETGLTEIEFAEGQSRIRLSRAAPAPTVAATVAPSAVAVAPAGPAAPVQTQAMALASHPGALTSPMVGTAYLAEEPGTPPFVRIGDQVKAGQTVLIIEAMKVMNPIKAPKSGVVTQLLIADAQPVEFGEVLLVIE
ncbi:MAG: acetyl-CoA carboxylase biotin carboxyl carrier protein [Azospirillaceae bacterium]|nr:acetyl-CoA carboxylase biotin carboxyl carrier protein [Azospirillaceae bacterium]